ncbi:MAG TPA: hypothetical protein VFG12_18480 [Rhodopila sp.]|nr:hypothetical protein [Rhodopila sp.]
MARNPAVKKAAKAAKRKAVVAAKRKEAIAANTLGGRIREAAQLPVRQCLVSENLFTNGMGTVVLVRGVSQEQQHIGFFMLDTFCLGLKDTYFRTFDRQDAEYTLDLTRQADGLVPIAPEEARKLVQDVVAWAAGNGFAAHEDYAVTSRLFSDIAAAETDHTARFGHEGKVLYVPGPSETLAEIQRRTRFVQSRFGEEAIKSIDFLHDDELDEFDDEYDLEGEVVPEEPESGGVSGV